MVGTDHVNMTFLQNSQAYIFCRHLLYFIQKQSTLEKQKICIREAKKICQKRPTVGKHAKADPPPHTANAASTPVRHSQESRRLFMATLISFLLVIL